MTKEYGVYHCCLLYTSWKVGWFTGSEDAAGSVENIDDYTVTYVQGKIVSHALQYGYRTKCKIENMHEQFLSRQAQGEGLKKQAAAEAADTGNEFTLSLIHICAMPRTWA